MQILYWLSHSSCPHNQPIFFFKYKFCPLCPILRLLYYIGAFLGFTLLSMYGCFLDQNTESQYIIIINITESQLWKSLTNNLLCSGLWLKIIPKFDFLFVRLLLSFPGSFVFLHSSVLPDPTQSINRISNSSLAEFLNIFVAQVPLGSTVYRLSVVNIGTLSIWTPFSA